MLRSGREQINLALEILYRGRWVIAATLLLAIGAAVGYLRIATPTYEASSFVLLAERPARPVAASQAGIAAAEAFSQWGRSLSNELTLLRNTPAIPAAVAKRLLDDGLQERIGVTADSLPVLATPDDRPLAPDRLASRVREQLIFASSDEGREGRMIEIRATSSSSREAAVLANLFAESYVQQTRRASRASLTASREFLERQVQEKGEELRAVEKRLGAFLRDQPSVTIDDERRNLSAQIGTLRARRDQIAADVKRHEAALKELKAQLQRLNPRLVEQMASSLGRDIEFWQEKAAELRADRETALLQNPQWRSRADVPELRRLNDQIAVVQERIDSLSRAYVDGAIAEGSGAAEGTSRGVDYGAELARRIANHRLLQAQLAAEQSVIDAQIARYRGESKAIPEQSLRLEELQRSRRRAEEMYTFLAQQLQETVIREQAELGYASLAAVAEVPDQPVAPVPLQLYVLGAFFGLAIGVAVAAVRHKMDDRLYSPAQLTERGYLHTTVIPDMGEFLPTRRSSRRRARAGEGPAVADSLVAVHQPTSTVTEAYRQLRADVHFGHAGPGHVLLVTSASGEEGKSTTAANLAVVLAKAGHRTLLVGADLRRPELHALFGRPNDDGLYQILRQEVRETQPTGAGNGSEGASSGAATDTERQAGGDLPFDRLYAGIDNLYVLAAGATGATDAAELVGSARMQALITAWRDAVDAVIIDSPPILAVSDAKLLARSADGVLVVVRAGRTREAQLDLAHAELRKAGFDGDPIVVLNGFETKMTYNDRYRYNSYSAYSS